MHHPPSAIRHPPSSRHRRAAGFTLIEAALTTVIVGTGVLAIVAAQQAYHQKNDWAQHTGTAMLLANEIRELTLPLPLHDPLSHASTLGPELNEPDIEDYDDLDDFAGIVNPSGMGAGLTINPPVNALRQVIPNMEGWTQFVMVEGVLPSNLASSTTFAIGSTDMVRVTVTVSYQGPNDESPMTLTQLSWVVPK
ncbi:MAG: hypothetical protein IT445_09950 [Phycisphaeraceae bacterium]|nr:hypothetical protein [Phycisphaeraceae bacterium]